MTLTATPAPIYVRSSAGGWMTIANRADAIEAYVRTHASPKLIADLERLAAKRPGLAARAWAAGLLLTHQRIRLLEKPQPIQVAPPFCARDWRLVLATVTAGNHAGAYKIIAHSSHPDSMIYCTCSDDTAPASPPICEATCAHIIAYVLTEEEK